MRMDKQTLRNDIRKFLEGRGISLHRLAQESGVDSSALWRFVNIDKTNLNTDSLFRLWPILYGEQRPCPVAPEEHPKEASA